MISFLKSFHFAAKGIRGLLLLLGLGLIFPMADLANSESTATDEPTPVIDLKTLAISKEMGLALDANTELTEINIVRFMDSFPAFIITRANYRSCDDSSWNQQMAYFKKDVSSPLIPTFRNSRNFTLIFSPNGKRVLVNWHVGAGSVDAFVFDTSKVNPLWKGDWCRKALKNFVIDFLALKRRYAVSVSDVARGQKLFLSGCVHKQIQGSEWLDDRHIKVNIYEDFCDPGDKKGEWDAILDLEDRKLTGIEQVRTTGKW